MAGEVELWRAVLRRAVEDLFLESEDNDKLTARRDAHEWFRIGGGDFQFVCQMNGLDADAVQDAYFKGIVDKSMLLTKARAVDETDT